MKKQANSNCIRCGKVRIFHKKWQARENGKGPLVTYEETVCPDPQCQKIVDAKFQEIRDRRTSAEDRKKNIVISRGNKQKPAEKPLAILKGIKPKPQN